MDEVRAYRGYRLNIYTPSHKGLWRVLIEAGPGMTVVSFFAGEATRDKVIQRGERRVDAELLGRHSIALRVAYARLAPGGCPAEVL